MVKGFQNFPNSPFAKNQNPGRVYVDFPDKVREIAPMGRPYVDFPDGVWEFRSRATAHPIWWQCFFVLFMNMVVVYVLGS